MAARDIAPANAGLASLSASCVDDVALISLGTSPVNGGGP